MRGNYHSSNLVRTRLITGDKSPDLKAMISDLALTHPDPAWQKWARDEVEVGKFTDPSPGLGQPHELTAPAPEALPMPSPVKEPELVAPHLELPSAVLPSEFSGG